MFFQSNVDYHQSEVPGNFNFTIAYVLHVVPILVLHVKKVGCS